MTADRYEIHDDGHLTIAIKHGANTLYIDELEDDFAAGAIRQQARDLDQLRGELAAAVAERDRYWGALHSTKDELFECRANQRTIKSELQITRDQRDTLRARLAAIDNAPTVAVIESLPNPNGLMCNYLMGVDVPASVKTGDELIIRPSKDKP